MRLNRLNELLLNFPETEKMPALFLGHGSPMNAVEENQFVQGFRAAGRALQRPAAILCVSAHWETRGTWVTAMETPRTIHDFGGFPPVLYEQQYPAPGSPELADLISETVQTTEVQHDHSWGLDHGAWSVIKHMYPEADTPVIQMSLDVTKSPQEHYELAKELQALRHRGVLIVGSGNMVHNLRRVDWNRLNETYAYDWAQEASEKMKSFIAARDHNALIHFQKQGSAFDLAIPTPEHYLPLLYALGLQGEEEDTALFNDQYLAGSLTMTSVKIA
jgi:4,5-DOPA dioxygenase extradiol